MYYLTSFISDNIDLKTPTLSIPRSSDVGLQNPRPSSINIENSIPADLYFECEPEFSVSDTQSTQAEILNELEQHFDQFNLSETVSRDSQSTSTSNTYPSIRRHQRKHSQDTTKESIDKTFTESELGYLEYVVNELYKLIVNNALDESGVQYRNTFAWKFQVFIPPFEFQTDERLKH
jgi:hypothetical protein